MIGTSGLLAWARARGVAVTLTAMLAIGATGGWIGSPTGPLTAAAQEDAVPLADLPVSLGGSRVSVPEATGKIREYELVATPTRWEVIPGVAADAYAYNGQVPGPTIRVTEGDALRVTLRNELNEPTSIRWHGLHVPNAMDGVPPLTQEAVEPGGLMQVIETKAAGEN